MAPKGDFGAHQRYDDPQPASLSSPSRASEERNAMAEVAVEVPAPVVPAVRDTVLLLYRATAEALQLSLDAHGEGREAGREVGRHRARLEQLGRMLDRLGWPGGPPEAGAGPAGSSAAAAGPVELRGPREVVHDALHGALIDAGERLAVACSATWHSEASEASVRELAAQVIALDGLARGLEAGGRGGR
jgi:hypothetical protein